MPFYEYQCQSCGVHEEALQKITDAPLRKCPSCGKNSLRKLMSAPVFRLKGSGWYETDFKSDQENKRNLAGQDKEETKAEAKPEAKPEARVEGKDQSKDDGKKEKVEAAKSDGAKGEASKSQPEKTPVAKPKARKVSTPHNRSAARRPKAAVAARKARR